jgi:hypothetical protein
MKPKDKEEIRMVAILLFYFLQKYYLKESCVFCQVLLSYVIYALH